MANGFLSSLFGRQAQTGQIPIQSPGQLGFMGGARQQAQQLLPQLAQGVDISPFLQQARTQFQQQTLPSIAERFSAMGAQRSSAFPQILGQAGAGLEESLAGLQTKAALQQQQQQQGLFGTLASLGMQPEFQAFREPESFGLLGNIAQGAGSFLPLGLASYFGGGMGGLGGLFGQQQPQQQGSGNLNISAILSLLKALGQRS